MSKLRECNINDTNSIQFESNHIQKYFKKYPNYESSLFYGCNYKIADYSTDFLYNIKVDAVQPYALKDYLQLFNQKNLPINQKNLPPMHSFQEFNDIIFGPSPPIKLHYGYYNAINSPMNAIANHGFLENFQSAEMHGINLAWGIPGLRGTFFNWHVEDEFLCAYNYLIGGDAKYWYCLKPSDWKKGCES